MTLPALTRRSVTVGEFSILLDVPSSSDSVLEHSLSGHSQNPYWGVLWDAAIPMARYITGRTWPAATSVLEVGCGVGLTGIAAQLSGLSVQMTDIVPEAIQLARHNAMINGLDDCRPSVLDWNQPTASKYSLILACDVLYERSQHAGLVNFLKAACLADTKIYIGDPGRQSSQQFIDDIEAADFHVELFREDGSRVEVFQPQQFHVFVLRPCFGKRSLC